MKVLCPICDLLIFFPSLWLFFILQIVLILETINFSIFSAEHRAFCTFSNYHFFFVVRIFKIYFLSNFQVSNTVLLAIITMLSITSPELVDLIMGHLYQLTNISPFLPKHCVSSEHSSLIILDGYFPSLSSSSYMHQSTLRKRLDRGLHISMALSCLWLQLPWLPQTPSSVSLTEEELSYIPLPLVTA